MKEACQYLRQQGVDAPEIGIILGTGLGKLVERVAVLKTIPYENIPSFPLSTVETHAGKLIYGTLGGKKVLVMQGRFHYYEGYTMQQVTFPIRVMKLLGINTLLISNAAGAVNLGYKKGSVMAITDHINLLGNNPLIGRNLDDFGPRFPDMSRTYTPALLDTLRQVARDRGIDLKEGVYAAMPGPMLETAAEYRMLGRLGADAVGMSTVPEAIVAAHCGMRLAAVSVLTDECDPDNLEPAELASIVAEAGKAEKLLLQLFEGLVERL